MKVYGQVESAQFEVLSSAPTPTPLSRFYWDSTRECMRFHNGDAWVDVSGLYTGGTRAAPTAIVAGTGVVLPGGGADHLLFINGSGGVTVTANPRVAAGTRVGQRLTLKGRSDTDYVIIGNGQGMSLNGDWFGGEDETLGLTWDGTNWSEDFRR